MVIAAVLRRFCAGLGACNSAIAFQTLVAGATILSAPDVQAQMSVSGAVGAVIPIGGSADFLNSGYQTTLAVTFKPMTLRNRLRVDAMLSEMLEKKSVGGHHRFVAATANIVMSGLKGPGPSGYVIAGAGSYQHTGDGERTTNFGANVGAGINFPVGSFGTFLESRFHYVADRAKTKLFPITFGLTF